MPVDATAERAAPIAGVIFDCDDTLVDSELINARGLTELFADDHGIVLDAREVQDEFRGGRFADMVTTLAARHRIDVGADFTPRYRARVHDIFAAELQPMPGVAAAIEAIDLPHCVASSGPQEKIGRALAVTGLDRYFGDRVFSAYTIEAWKPTPDLFLWAARELGVAPEHCAVIEDSDAGVEAARRAGMRVFGYDVEGAIGAHPWARLTRFCDYAELPALIAAG